MNCITHLWDPPGCLCTWIWCGPSSEGFSGPVGEIDRSTSNFKRWRVLQELCPLGECQKGKIVIDEKSQGLDGESEFRPWLRASLVKNLPEVQETWVQSLGQEDPLEEEMATHFSVLTWRSHGQSMVGYCPWGHKESDTTEWLHFRYISHLE